MQKDRKEDDPAEPVGDQKAGRDGDAVEESMNCQAKQYGVTLVGVDELVFVGFFAEMEMRCDGVFEKMNDEIAHKHEVRSIFWPQLQAGRENLHDGRSQHESRTEGDEVF